MLFRPDGQLLDLRDFYQLQSAFLLCAGPSLLQHDLSRLNQSGLLTMAVNNVAAVHRPQLWTCVDDPGHFVDALWHDPGVLKFVPVEHFDKPLVIRNEDGELCDSSELVRNIPAVFGYRRNDQFVAEHWLYEDSFNWGNHGGLVDSTGNRGSRSVMYVALKLLYYFGVRTVYLLGCDFRMELGQQNYAFEQDRSPSSVRGNNNSYRVLNDRLGQLLPFFEREGFTIFNCTPNSGLTVFSHMPFEQAVADATAGMPRRVLTAGMYDRKAREKANAKEAASCNSEVTALQNATAIAPLENKTPHKRALKLEIVSHCWRYARLISYQLSSLVRYPPSNCMVTMTVFHSANDDETCRVLDFFSKQQVRNVSWRWWQLEEPQLFRRAIGRNMAALGTEADWIWFCDCDQVFHDGCLDSLASQLANADESMVYPECVHFSPSQCATSDLLRAADGAPRIIEIDSEQFRPKRFNRAVGGLQIVRGDIARSEGYCKDIARFMRPASQWMRTFEDVAFRKSLGTRGTPISVPGLYRIEHAIKGRKHRSMTLGL